MTFDFTVFYEALVSHAFMRGALITLTLAVVAHITAILMGFPLAIAGLSEVRLLRWAAASYIWLFRGAPTLLQLLFVWNALPQLFPALRADWFSPFLAAWLALSLNEAAYQAEITRSALSSVDVGQRLASLSIGMTRWQAFRYVTLPQALRVGIPPTGNEFITLLKVTSLASVISLQELLAVTSQSIAVTYKYMELYAAALVYYMAAVSVLMVIQHRVETALNWMKRGESATARHVTGKVATVGERR
ncbi:MAG: amino acid ABC transporter permease [Variibacter sp.]